MLGDKLIHAYYLFIKHQKWEDAYSCIQVMYNKDNIEAYKYVKEYRETIQRVKGYNEYFKRSYLLTARDRFDDFMIYIEWNRPLSEQYWLPRRSKLLEVANALQDLEDGQMDELFLQSTAFENIFVP